MKPQNVTARVADAQWVSQSSTYPTYLREDIDEALQYAAFLTEDETRLPEETLMHCYALFVSYLENQRTGTWKKMTPQGFEAANEEEASRTAITLANFAYPEFVPALEIRVVADYDPGRPIAEIRRPFSD